MPIARRFGLDSRRCGSSTTWRGRLATGAGVLPGKLCSRRAKRRELRLPRLTPQAKCASWEKVPKTLRAKALLHPHPPVTAIALSRNRRDARPLSHKSVGEVQPRERAGRLVQRLLARLLALSLRRGARRAGTRPRPLGRLGADPERGLPRAWSRGRRSVPRSPRRVGRAPSLRHPERSELAAPSFVILSGASWPLRPS